MRRFSLIILMLAAVAGCTRERPSEKPPIHVNLNMDFQERYNPQAKSKFFADSSAMRPLVPGTVARGWLRENVEYYTGKDEKGQPIKKNPVPIDLPLLKRGQQRFNIYCSPCHSRLGDGKGIMVERGYLPPPSFHQALVRNYPDGHIFDVITNGIRNMPSYGAQVPVADRWAIIAYIRALERSQNATLNDVPVELRNKLR
jgi:mono/diheme cytochrome c family protein